MNINSQQLRYFMELAKCLNFTRAAANLYVAQPTLSQQIAELETQLGVALFVRSSRSVSLTPAGQILYGAYPNIVAQVKQVQHRMLATAAGFSGSMTIGFLDAFTDFIPLIMRNFRNAFPDISLKPVCATLNELNDGLKNHTIDVAFSLIPEHPAEESAAFQSRLILHDSMGFVLPADHAAPGDYSFTEALPLVSFDEATDAFYYPNISACLGKLGIRVPKVIFTDSIGNIRAYLESGVGFSVLSSRYSAFFSGATQFVPIPGEYLDFGALWDPDSANPALPLFLEALEQFMEPDPEPTEPQ